MNNAADMDETELRERLRRVEERVLPGGKAGPQLLTGIENAGITFGDNLTVTQNEDGTISVDGANPGITFGDNLTVTVNEDGTITVDGAAGGGGGGAFPTDLSSLTVHDRLAVNAPERIEAGNDHLYIWDEGNDDIIVIDATDPANLTATGNNIILDYNFGGHAVNAAGDTLFIQTGDETLAEYDISGTPGNPSLTTTHTITGFWQGRDATMLDNGTWVQVDANWIAVAEPPYTEIAYHHGVLHDGADAIASVGNVVYIFSSYLELQNNSYPQAFYIQDSGTAADGVGEAVPLGSVQPPNDLTYHPMVTEMGGTHFSVGGQAAQSALFSWSLA